MKGRTELVLAGLAVLGLSAAAAAVALGGKPADALAGKKAEVPLEFAAADLVRLMARSLTVERALPGSVQATSQATVRSKLSAEVRAVHVREGQRVAPGQVLVEFDTAALKVQLAERTATLESARASLAQNERTRQVNAQLVKQNFISQNAFDAADAAWRAQAAAVEAAQAQLAQTQLLLNDATVRAPIGGHVSRRHVQPGEKVSFDAPLVGIVDLAQLEIQAQAPVSDVASIATGAPATVRVEGVDRPFEGRVERINPAAEPGTRSINFHVWLPPDHGVLRVGMFAKVFVQVGSAAAVPALPLSAIRSANGQDFVWLLVDGRLRKRNVTLGRRDEREQMVEVLGGLTTADPVIATKFDNLRDGQAARVVGAAGALQRSGHNAAPAPVN